MSFFDKIQYVTYGLQRVDRSLSLTHVGVINTEALHDWLTDVAPECALV